MTLWRQCPNCGSTLVRRASNYGVSAAMRVLSLLLLQRRWKCERCRCRFTAFRFRRRFEATTAPAPVPKWNSAQIPGAPKS